MLTTVPSMPPLSSNVHRGLALSPTFSCHCVVASKSHLRASNLCPKHKGTNAGSRVQIMVSTRSVTFCSDGHVPHHSLAPANGITSAGCVPVMNARLHCKSLQGKPWLINNNMEEGAVENGLELCPSHLGSIRRWFRGMHGTVRVGSSVGRVRVGWPSVHPSHGGRGVWSLLRR